MGASASTTKSTIESEIINNSYASCPAVAASSVATLKNVNHEPLESCEDSEFVVKQDAAVNANCVIANMQDSMADLMTTAGAEAQAGLGLSVSTDISEIKSSIQQSIIQECKDISSDNYLEVEGVNTKACNFYFIQETDAQVACELNASQTLATEVAEVSAAGAAGFDPTAAIFGIVIICIVAGVIYLVYKGFAKPAANPPEIGVSVPTATTTTTTATTATVPVATAPASVPSISSSNLATAANYASSLGLPVSVDEVSKMFGGFTNDTQVFVANMTKSNSILILIILVLIAIVLYYDAKKHKKHYHKNYDNKKYNYNNKQVPMNLQLQLQSKLQPKYTLYG
jgi:hypothetical protein